MLCSRSLTFAAALMLSFFAQAEQLYKCQGADGEITYSNEPCPKADKTMKTITPGDGQGSVTVIPSETRGGKAATPAAVTADNKKCAAYGAEIRDIDSRLAHGFVAGEEESLKARRKTLADVAFKECFSERKAE
ncbi:MAG: DUF4124 domain-containing protein [Burkholderiales bacterium]